MKVVSLTNILEDKFDLVLKIDDSIEKLQIKIFDSKGIWGIESAEFEELLWNSGSAKTNQRLIADIKRKYLTLKKTPELQAA